jgi:hypothetical protein
MLLVECNVLEQVKVIKEGTEGNSRLRLRGKFQQCDEQNNNGRIYPRKILEAQVQAIQEKIGDRSLVGALDHPANDAIHLSQASHVITGLSVDKDGSVIGECEILSTPNGKIVEALINDGVKIGISSRGVGSVTEGIKGKIVNEDFKLITFDLVSDPSTRGAYPELTESIRENSQRAQEIVSKHKKDRVLLTMLENKITEAMKKKKKKLDPVGQEDGDIDNDGDEDETDGYLRNRRNAVRKAIMGKKHEASPLFTPKEKKASKEAPSILRKPGDTSPAIPGGRKPARFQFKSDEVDSTKPIVPAKRKEHPNIQVASTEIIGQKIIEGFKRACWGDRYDEVTGQGVMAAARSSPARRGRRNRRRPQEGATDTHVATATPAQQAQGYETDVMRDRRGGKSGTTVLRRGRTRFIPDRENASTTIERFADVIRERCWKGYEPVKGKKPYSKGSCKKK